jgi:SAM-dependent methyltransferase
MNTLRRKLSQVWLTLTMHSSASYWERRYRLGLTSGSGSEGDLASYKAGVLNDFVREHDVRTVVEFGCGDGQQLALADYRQYLGLDVSAMAIELCRARFGADLTKSFLRYDPASAVNLGAYLGADLTLSLDVIYHLVEDEAYDSHLRDLFGVSRRHVVIYASNGGGGGEPRHVRHRRFPEDVKHRFPWFRLTRHLPNPYRESTFADFYLFERDPITAA